MIATSRPSGPASSTSGFIDARPIRIALVVSVYLGLLVLTHTSAQGDTSLYAASLIERLHGRPADFWEFGHAIWRPLVIVLFRLLHPTIDASDAVVFEQVVNVMTGLAMLGGAAGLIAFQSWMERLELPHWPALAGTIALGAASAYVGYAQTGSSYIPSVAMLIVGLRAMAANDRRQHARTIAEASMAFALAVLFWFPMVLAVPAGVISAIVLRGDSGSRRRVAGAVCLLSGMMTVVAYAAVAYLAGVRSVADLRTWMAAATHDIVGIGGVPRAIVGFGRSLVNMDRLGLVAKRYLLHDPYNSATVADIARAGLLRLALLYALLAGVAVALMRRPPGRGALVFLMLTAVPVVGFALKWQGGDLERYLALFPALFLAVALAIASLPSSAQRTLGGAVALLMVAVNVPAISRAASVQECETLAHRIESVPRADARAIVIITPHELDEITSFASICPASPLLKTNNPPRIYGLVTANNLRAPLWREQVAARAARAWASGGHLWVSRRAFADAPDVSSKWAEGDDPTVHWRDFPQLFRQLDVGAPVGGADGFVEILPTGRSKAALDKVKKRAP